MRIIKRIWNGDASLLNAYWIPGLLVVGAFYFFKIFHRMVASFTVSMGYEIAAYVIFAIFIPSYILWIVGVFKSIFKRKTGLWGLLAIVSQVLTVFPFIFIIAIILDLINF